MVSFRVAGFIIFTTIFIFKISADYTPMVFGISGSNVTLRSTCKEISGVFLRVSWYRIMPNGRVELIAYFSSYSTELGRYSGNVPEGTTEVSLTISNVTFEDSGQYFPAVHEGQKISTGLVTLLTVIDPRRDPNLQLLVSHKPDGRVDILCEMRDVGLDWDGPRLELVDDTDTSLMDNKTGEAIDNHNVFVRSAMISYALEKQTARVACVSQKKDRQTVRRREVTLQRDEMICPWLLYLSLLCGVLFVVTMGTGVVWFCKTK